MIAYELAYDLDAVLWGTMLWLGVSYVLFVVTIALVVSWSSKSNRHRIAVDVILAGVAFVALDVFCALMYLELKRRYHSDIEWPGMVLAVLNCAACIVGIVKRPAHQATAPELPG